MSRFHALLICNSYGDRQHEHKLLELPGARYDGADVEEWLWEQLDEQRDSAHVVTTMTDLDASAMINEITSLGNELERMEHKPLVRPSQSSWKQVH
jgi:hypothetical protein